MGCFDAGKTKTKSTSSSSYSPEVTAATNQAVGAATNILGQTYNPALKGTAGLTQDQIAAQGLLQGMQGQVSAGNQQILAAGQAPAGSINNTYQPGQITNGYQPGTIINPATGQPTTVQAPAGDPTAQITMGQGQPGTVQSGYTAGQYGGPQSVLDDITGANGQSYSTQDYMDPYIQQVVAQQLADLQRQSKIRQQDVDARAHQAGAYGDSGYGIMSDGVTENLFRESTAAANRGYSDAFNTAMGLKTGDINRIVDLYKTRESLGQTEAGMNLDAAKTNLAAESDFWNRDLRTQEANASLSEAERNRAFDLAKTNAGYADRNVDRDLDVARLNEQNRASAADRDIGVQDRNLGYQQQGAQMDLDTQARNAALQEQALGRQMSAPGQALNLSQDYASSLNAVGEQERQIEQQRLTAQYEEELRRQGYPAEQVKLLANILATLPKNQTTTGTQTTPTASTFSQIMGPVASIAGAALGTMSGNPLAALGLGGGGGGAPMNIIPSGTPSYGGLY